MHSASIFRFRVTEIARHSLSCTPPGGFVALSVECRTCDQEIVHSSRGVKTMDNFLTPVPLSPEGDALRLASKGRYGLCVGGR